jgi:hypothetical protein
LFSGKLNSLKLFKFLKPSEMKKLIFSFAIAAITLAACNSTGNKSAANQNENNGAQASSPTDNAATASVVKNTSATKEIVTQYLLIKDGLANDNGKDAATSAKAFVQAIGFVDIASFNADQKKTWEDISADAKEMAEHIGENPGKLEHQREHFVMLSKDIFDLVKAFGSEQVLYKVFDSMSNEGKGAFWLNANKEIKNPYMGKAMSGSGTIQEEIK